MYNKSFGYFVFYSFAFSFSSTYLFSFFFLFYFYTYICLYVHMCSTVRVSMNVVVHLPPFIMQGFSEADFCFFFSILRIFFFFAESNWCMMRKKMEDSITGISAFSMVFFHFRNENNGEIDDDLSTDSLKTKKIQHLFLAGTSGKLHGK